VSYIRQGVANAVIAAQDAVLARIVARGSDQPMFDVVVSKLKWDETVQIVSKARPALLSRPTPVGQLPARRRLRALAMRRLGAVRTIVKRQARRPFGRARRVRGAAENILVASPMLPYRSNNPHPNT